MRQVSLGRRERQDGAAPIRHSDKRIVHHVDHKQKIVADRMHFQQTVDIVEIPKKK